MAISLEREHSLWRAGATVVAGVDEVGRGAIAGPVSVGVVALAPRETWPMGLKDSKELAPRTREELVPALAAFGLAWAVGSASSAEIDRVGIVAALRLAGVRALATIAAVGVLPDAILLDGTHDWLTPPDANLLTALSSDPATDPMPPVVTVVRGDSLCASIAAASVFAKVARDEVMVEAHLLHPEYGWAGNKGYGSAGHLAALERHGPAPWHRVSWNIPGGGRARSSSGA